MPEHLGNKLCLNKKITVWCLWHPLGLAIYLLYFRRILFRQIHAISVGHIRNPMPLMVGFDEYAVRTSSHVLNVPGGGNLYREMSRPRKFGASTGVCQFWA